jgi:phosphohistidine swiveling domain-containing protein
MASRTTSTDEVLGRLLLDIKALMLLSSTNGTLPAAVRERIVSSHDEQITAFVSTIGTSSKRATGGKSLLLIALSEMVLASILAVVGLALLAPSIVGFSSQSQLIAYSDQVISGISVQSLSGPLIPAAEFVIAVVLLVGAFYNLRIAAANLKAIEPKGSTGGN